LAQLDDVETILLSSNLPPETLVALDQMPRLRRVVAQATIDERHAALIAKSSAIDVDLWGNVDDAQLAALASSQRIQRLETIFFYTGEPAMFTDHGVESLSGMQNLKSLSLKSDHVTPAAAPSLARMSQLEELHLWLPRMSSGLPEALAGKPLRTLSLARMQLDDATWQAIGQLDQLDTLCIHRPVPVGAPPALDHSVGLDQLDRLNLSINRPPALRLPTAALGPLCKLKHLRRLRLDYELSADEIRSLLKHTSVEYLVLGSDITEKDGRALVAEFPRVRLRYETGGVDQFCSGTD
jgi:hypothetical protein